MSEGKQITYEDLEELLKDDNKVKVGGKSRFIASKRHDLICLSSSH